METRNQEITAGWVDVLIQSGISAERYFQAARKTLDKSGMKYKAADVIALANIAASDYSPSELSIVGKRTESTNTYVNLVGVKDKKEYVCIINGGNLFSLGMTNPPVCGKKGERINATPFQR